MKRYCVACVLVCVSLICFFFVVFQVTNHTHKTYNIVRKILHKDHCTQHLYFMFSCKNVIPFTRNLKYDISIKIIINISTFKLRTLLPLFSPTLFTVPERTVRTNILRIYI